MIQQTIGNEGLVIRPGAISLQDASIKLTDEWKRYADECLSIIVNEQTYEESQSRFAELTIKLRDAGKVQASFEKPIKDYLKFFKTSVDTALLPMNKALNYLDKSLRDYRRLVEEARLKQQAHLNKLAENQRARDIAKGRVPQVPESLAPIVPSMAKTAEVDSGAKVTARVIWHAEITNVALIPREYMVPDLTRLNGVARALKENFNVPGARAIKEESFAVRE